MSQYREFLRDWDKNSRGFNIPIAFIITQLGYLSAALGDIAVDKTPQNNLQSISYWPRASTHSNLTGKYDHEHFQHRGNRRNRGPWRRHPRRRGPHRLPRVVRPLPGADADYQWAIDLLEMRPTRPTLRVKDVTLLRGE